MAQAHWTQPAAPFSAEAIRRRVASRFPDWEGWLTLGLALAAVLTVSLSLEGAAWSRDMPAITLVAVLALGCALLLARWPLGALTALPLAVLLGALVVFWQTLEMVGPGDLWQRMDSLYFRFSSWLNVVFGDEISNDPLPFNVLVLSLTWLGVFSFGWGLFRWHNAWLGLIPGGVALFLTLVFVDDRVRFAVFVYVLLAFLLMMRAELTSRMERWRQEGTDYPPLISLTFLHYGTWAALFLMAAAWIAPVGPFPTPAVVSALSERLEGVGLHFVRLAGPLHVRKVVPVHDYTGILPFQGSIRLGERELLSVRVEGASDLVGPIALRGAVYEEYAGGGWKAAQRETAELTPAAVHQVQELMRERGVAGRQLAATVTVEAKSVVGSVVFFPGQPLSALLPSEVEVAEGSIFTSHPYVPNGGIGLTDEEVLRQAGGPGGIPVAVERDAVGAVTGVRVLNTAGLALPDTLVTRPHERVAKGGTYRAFGILREVDWEELRASREVYPSWVGRQYLQLPGSLPERVRQLAFQVAGGEPTAYDRAKAIEGFLRQYPVEYRIGDTPPGKDTVDQFLFESKGGYFDYHASAMVVMLRALGVPARLAVGFVIDRGDFNEKSGSYLVRDEDAYAWAEVYFSGQGWVEFNPSPDLPAELRPREIGEGIPAPPLDLDDIPGLPVSSGAPFPIGPGDVAPGGESATGGGGADLGYAPWVALAAAGLLAAAAGSAALGWRRSVAGLPYAQALWEKTVRLATWAGQRPQAGQTPAEFARRLERAFRGVRDIPLLAAAYSRSRFGRREPDEGEGERLREMWPHLRGALLAAILRRPWRRR